MKRAYKKQIIGLQSGLTVHYSLIVVHYLKLELETAEYAKPGSLLGRQGPWQHTPYKINSQHVKDIIDPGSQFHICASVQSLKAISLYKVEIVISIAKTPP